jgi:hypothetical protein
MSWIFLSLWGKEMMHDKVLVWFIYDIKIYLNLKDIICLEMLKFMGNRYSKKINFQKMHWTSHNK